jgi:hypothetical protein
VVAGKFIAKGRQSVAIQDLTIGSGKAVQLNDQCGAPALRCSSGSFPDVIYSAWGIDAAPDSKSPLMSANSHSFRLGGSTAALKGLDQGLVGMQIGGKRIVCMPADVAFGNAGFDGVPANTDVLLEVF